MRTKRMTADRLEKLTKAKLEAALHEYGDAAGLIFLEGFGWWIKDRPYPPANYYPSGSLPQLDTTDLPKA